MLTLADSQLAIISQTLPQLDLTEALARWHLSHVESLSDTELAHFCMAANACYRAGEPFVTDKEYDGRLLAELQQRVPDHPFLQAVEAEPIILAKTVTLPQRMLSTDKAYTQEDIQKWAERLQKGAIDIDVAPSDIMLRVTPKLDGYAAFDDGQRLYTRGDGVRGQDISRAFERGLQVYGGAARGLGAGEIVTSPRYFKTHLSEGFENPRNIQAAVIAEKKVDPVIQKTIEAGACVFFPFSQLPAIEGGIEEILSDFDNVVAQVSTMVEYDIDGVIFETTHSRLKAHMGATRKFHRWQIAFKSNVDSAEVVVLSITPQTSRTGRITPVAELQPTKLSGATLSRATAHHYGMVKAKRIGPGAVVELVRSGLVIPKIERVVTEAEPQFPDTCPSCDGKVVWDGDHIICPNTTECPAQTENSLIHFFKTLGNVDGFGPKVIEKIHQAGIKRIHDIYAQTANNFVEMGFGEKTAENLVQQLLASRSLAIEDWRFLAAFGITRMGQGNCERLLQHHTLLSLFELTVEQLVEVDGFAELSAIAAVEGLAAVKDEFMAVYGLGFNLEMTETDTVEDSRITGKTLVFTGAMRHGSRVDMEKQAKTLGAKVAKSVSAKTDYLVTGEKVGESKIAKAKEKGVTVISEAEYLALIETNENTGK